MAKGISIHIGINYVDKKHYGSKNELKFCMDDALKMQDLAIKNGFETSLLLNEEATSNNLQYLLNAAATSLLANDILLISYSGHGSYIKDLNKDEKDGFDQTWVLYDRMFIDDELYFALSKFRLNTRIFIISDSCYSGTITRDLNHAINNLTSKEVKKIEFEKSKSVYAKNEDHYISFLKHLPSPLNISINASIILLAACQDNEKAIEIQNESIKQGYFTHELLNAWNKGGFSGNYLTFFDLINARMKRNQSVQNPNYFFIGRRENSFQDQKPFTI